MSEETDTVTCEECAFRFGAEHTQADYSHDCPLCEVRRLNAEQDDFLRILGKKLGCKPEYMILLEAVGDLKAGKRAHILAFLDGLVQELRTRREGLTEADCE